jgi:predicted FMN-binding regulatory protein PaiB
MQLFLFEFFDFSACVIPLPLDKVTHGGFDIHIHLSHTNMSVKVLDAYLRHGV